MQTIQCRMIVFAIALSLVSSSQAYGQGTSLTGKWYGGSGDVYVKQSGSGIIINNTDPDYPTQWSGQLGMGTNTIEGSWECSAVKQKGTFRFVYDPNYKPGYMERIAGTYYIEDQYGKDPRDFYADREIKKGTEKPKPLTPSPGSSSSKSSSSSTSSGSSPAPRSGSPTQGKNNLSGQWVISGVDNTTSSDAGVVTITQVGNKVSWKFNGDFDGTISGDKVNCKWICPPGITGTCSLTYDPKAQL
jgi:hypothetical protein